MLFRKNNNPTHAAEPLLSVISSDVNMLGTLVCDGMMDFGGTIDGNIRCHTLTVRASGNVRGDVEADTVHIYGKVNGIIKAKHVHLYAQCHVEGIVMHETIKMEEGAFLDGKCKRMDKPSLREESFADEAHHQNVSVMGSSIRLIS